MNGVSVSLDFNAMIQTTPKGVQQIKCQVSVLNTADDLVLPCPPTCLKSNSMKKKAAIPRASSVRKTFGGGVKIEDENMVIPIPFHLADS